MVQNRVVAYLEKKEAECSKNAIIWFMKDATGPLRSVHVKAKTPYGVILKLSSFYREKNIDPERNNSMELITNPDFYPPYIDEVLEALIDKDVEYFVEKELGKVTEATI